MKIYTKTGDKGETSLIGGARVKKYNNRIEAYGTLDELNSYIGIIRSSLNKDICTDLLASIQDRLFTIGSILASATGSKMIIPDLKLEDITDLENEIDEMNLVLPELKSFILSGSDLVSSHCHVARCICRRAERLVIRLAEDEIIENEIIVYLNRLSDYFFVLARFQSFKNNSDEITWKPRL